MTWQPRPDESSTDDSNVYADAKTYYTASDRHVSRFRPMHRTYSQNGLMQQLQRISQKQPFRRGSLDTSGGLQNRRLLIHVDPTLAALQAQEDTDNNWQITIEDNGPKVLTLATASSDGHKSVDIRGTYMLSNLLQELTLAQQFGRKQIILDESRLNENPVNRLSRLIKHEFWDGLTRRLDASSIEASARDPKDWTDDPRPRIYIPTGAAEQFDYYSKIAKERPELRLDVRMLPPADKITPEYVQSLNSLPGVLALDMDVVTDPKTGEKSMRGVPFVVPGGRFNELYGWDSYMESLGLLVNDRADLAKDMVRNFCFCIRHYGKILNANRSYYLCRAQPPFLTDMAIRVYERIKHEPGAKEFLQTALLAAINEYFNIWACKPRLDSKTGLSRYRPTGAGFPPETEAGHFDAYIRPLAEKRGISIDEFFRKYDSGELQDAELDNHLMHDRAMRESGHDTSYRFKDVCADLATIDLNSCLFKYETDFARTISNVFDGGLVMTAEYSDGTPFKPGEKVPSAMWDRRAKRRRMAIDKYLWNEQAGMYFDYNTALQKQCTYESCTTFWALWAGVASPKQAADLVHKALPKFEVVGGLLSGTEESRGPISVDRPLRQWDYPFGWAPQQILAWTGLIRYGFAEDAERLAYKWLYLMTKAFVDFNGVVAEKYDVTRPIDPHRVDAEYGNQGLGFRGVAKEGFGWVNASFVYGLQIVNGHMRRALGTTTPYPTFLKAVEQVAETDRAEADRAEADRVESDDDSPVEAPDN